MKKITLLALTLVLLFSCETIEYVPVETIIEVPVAPDGKLFPLTPARVILQDDLLLNEIMLGEKIIEWQIRDIKIKYILKMITKEQYKIWFDEDMEAMGYIHDAYKLYYKSKETE